MLNELSLFSGYGGFSLGLRLAGIQTRTVAYVEWEKYPQEIIKARIRDGFLDDAPIFGDISAFRGEQFRGVVDILSAGFPCQPHSVAGAKRGATDQRNLWPATLRVISEVRPTYVILENVPGLLSASSDGGTPAYGGIVVGELAQIGYGVHWQTIGADDVGAPHRRKRWWCTGVAYSNGTGPGGETRDNYTIGAFSREGSEPRLDQRGRELAYPSGGRYRESDEEVRTRGNSTEHGNGQLADSRHDQRRGRDAIRDAQGEPPSSERTHEAGSGRGNGQTWVWPERESGDGSTAKELADIPTWPPGPSDADGWERVLRERPDLAPALDKEVESQFRGMGHGRSHRVDELKALGNGIVPAVAAEFLERVGIADTMKGGGI